MTMKPSDLYRLLNAATLIAAALLPSSSIAWSSSSSSLLSITSRRRANNANNRLPSPCSYYSSNTAYLSPIKSSFNSLLCNNRQREAAAVAPLKSSQVDITNSSEEAEDASNQQQEAVVTKTTNNEQGNNKKNLVIGPRIGSGTYGTVHIALLKHNIDNDNVDDSDSGSRSIKEKTYYIAKRAWTLSEFELNVPLAVMELDDNNDELNTGGVNRVGTGLSTAASATGLVKDDNSSDGNSDGSEKRQDSLQEKAERCQYYWNVERHIFEKLQRQQYQQEGDVDSIATPQFIGVFRSDNENDKGEEEEIVPGYGKLDVPNNSDGNNNNDGNDNILGGFLSAITNNNNNSDDDDNKEYGHEWMVFEYIPSSIDDSSQPLTLLDAMEIDVKNQEVQQQRIQLDYQNHSLDYISKALNVDANMNDDIFGNTLDVMFVSLLEDLKIVHDCNIVHRDVKPGNLLCDGANNRLRLIDFGSGADLDPSSPPLAKQQQSSNGLGNIFSDASNGQQQQEEQKRRVGFDEGIAALSPIYSAPETFVKLDANPLSFDVFSAAVIMCQLLFNTLDERSNTEFTRQLREVNYDLDAWLKNSLGNDEMIGPSRFDDALEYLGERRGLWGLLKKMLQPNPMNRISSAMASESLREVLTLKTGETEWSDENIARVAREESYLETVIDSFDKCTISYGDGQDDNRPRPLHFLASFAAGMPVGLVLSEASGDDIDDNSDMSEEAKRKWKEATKFAFPGEVFVKGWSTNGQADRSGIFEVGDRLRGVGELPFTNAGFEAAVDLIERQPMTRGTLKLHFDRLSASKDQVQSSQNVGSSAGKKVTSQGVWKAKGRRGDQEDSFVLHEIKNDVADGSILLAGVFDGHAGTAASDSVSNILPFFYRDKLSSSTSGEEAGPSIRDALEASWRTTCNTYRNGCDENGEVVVDYDPIEGVTFKETRSASPVEAGCTATVAAISMNPSSGANELTILNCGDSKTILVGEPAVEGGGGSVVVFETRDHSPDDKIEIERLSRGKELGLDYSIPEDSPYGPYMRVGDFQYALCRSLEGSYVTSKGIVSDPDITKVNLASALAGRQHNAIVLACDGLLEVMSSEEIGREVVLMRKAGYKAGEVAKNLCGQALKRGSYDNISVIVVHLDG